jgi:hypothetical protein
MRSYGFLVIPKTIDYKFQQRNAPMTLACAYAVLTSKPKYHIIQLVAAAHFTVKVYEKILRNYDATHKGNNLFPICSKNMRQNLK